MKKITSYKLRVTSYLHRKSLTAHLLPFTSYLILLFAFCFLPSTLNAQWFVGGGLGINVKQSEAETNNINTAKNTTIGFSISPKGGYYFNEKFAVGLNFSVGYNFYDYFDNTNMNQKHHTSAFLWRANPFTRYSVFTYKKFSLILEGSIGVGGSQATETRSDFNNNIKYNTSVLTIGVFNITPLLGFKLNDHFQFEAGLNFLNLGYNIDISNSTQEREGFTKTNSTNISHDFNIGFNSSSIFSISQLTFGVLYKF